VDPQVLLPPGAGLVVEHRGLTLPRAANSAEHCVARRDVDRVVDPILAVDEPHDNDLDALRLSSADNR
jgi:hypothetical protein